MDRKELGKIIEVIEEAKKNIAGDTSIDKHDAENQYEQLELSDGPVFPKSIKPELKEVKKDDYIEYTDKIPIIIGLDASRTGVYNIGTKSLICISNCRFSTKEISSEYRHQEVNDKKIIGVVIYTKNEVERNIIEKIENNISDEDTDVILRVINEVKPESQVRQYLRRTSLLLAESSGLSYLTDKKINSFIFLDGPIYPLSITQNKMFDNKIYQDENEWKGLLGEIMNNYKKSIKISVDEKIPIIGAVKNIDSRLLINTLNRLNEDINNEQVIWPNDNSFLSELLYTKEFGKIKYTGWFEEKETNLHKPQAKKVFKKNENWEKYNKNFFYARLPKKSSISRFEIIEDTVSNSRSREIIEKRILSEISRSGDVPLTILEADDKARIKKKQQNIIKNAARDITSRYNEERF